MSKLINLFSDSDKLEGNKSYKTWHRLIESTLIYNELWQGICDGDVKPNKPTNANALAKWEIKNAKALALIKSSMNDEMYVHIENATDAWPALKIFKDLFDTQPESKKVNLQLKLLQQKLTEGSDVLEYLSTLKNIKQEIINVGFPVDDDSFMVTIIIAGLPSSYTHFLETLQVTGKLEKLKFDELCEMLSQHDKTFGKKKKVGEDFFLTEASTSKSSADSSRGRCRGNQNQAAHNRGRSQRRGNNFNRGGRNNFQGRGNNQGRGSFRGQGYNNQDCRTSIKKIPKFQQHSTQFANDQDEDDSEYVFTSSPASQISSHLKSDYEDAWILDSEATQHMTCRRDFFWNFQDCQLNSIFLADDTKHTPYGKGVVKVFLPGIGEKMISNVWYVPSFKKNLLSLVTIRQVGHQVIMEDGLVKINSVKQNLKTVMTGYEDGKLLRMKGIVIPRHSDFGGAVTTGISPIILWHVRYGHLNFESLSQLQKQGMVKGLLHIKRENAKCEACIYGKQNRESFPTSSWRANRQLQLVHNDVCGPLQTSFGVCKYFLLFIDDFSRMTWVYFLKHNSEAFDKFKISRQLVENEVKEKIGTLRIDNGGEFTSNEFKTYCSENGIR
eukprot:PITA_28683